MCNQLANIIIQTSTQHFLTKKILNKLCINIALGIIFFWHKLLIHVADYNSTLHDLLYITSNKEKPHEVICLIIQHSHLSGYIHWFVHVGRIC